ncbi:MAG: polyhydroxyalkanoate synthesis regulator DNA-binding domain-containing protein [Thermodesulfobacteriota bacterium]|nr:polyhydroxyalkanoate synthesis regulator DNA-binding domain-containing protein [Thermodesulfobacteriota bacterium]
MAERILYKKYANRRLYDTEQSKYVTLTEVARQIRYGRQVEAIDAKTKKDVTAFVLTQILLEQAKNKTGLLPVPLLHLIIQFGDNVLMDFFQKHLQQTITSYLSHKSSADDQFKKWLEMGTDISTMARRNLAEMNPFRNIFEQFLEKKKTDDENE